jgi:hypothetical protein
MTSLVLPSWIIRLSMKNLFLMVQRCNLAIVACAMPKIWTSRQAMQVGELGDGLDDAGILEGSRCQCRVSLRKLA